MAILDPENVMRRSRAENASYVIDQLRSLDLFPQPTSRLMRMHRALNRGYVPFDHPDFPIALEAERDMQQLGFVFDVMRAHADNPEFQRLVKRVLKDSVLPQDDRETSPGRDAQFELYLAAICQNAGLLPVDCAEPDVTCVIQRTTLGMAAKRLKSLSHLEKHVRKGAVQVAKTKLPGVIALDVSFARNPQNVPILSQVQNELYALIAQLHDHKFFDEHHVDIYRWVADKGVFAVLLFDFRFRRRPNQQWGLDGTITWLSTAHDDERANRHYRIFYDGFLRGVPNVTDSAAEQ